MGWLQRVRQLEAQLRAERKEAVKKSQVLERMEKDMGVSENRGTLFWGPYNKDPTI